MAEEMERGIAEAKGLMGVTTDPEKEPYKSKYKARQIINGLLAMLGEINVEEEEKAKEAKKIVKGKEEPKAMDERKRAWLGRLHHLMAVNYSETEEGGRSKPHLKRAKECLEVKPLQVKWCGINHRNSNQYFAHTMIVASFWVFVLGTHPVELIDVYNHIGINRSNRQEFKEHASSRHVGDIHGCCVRLMTQAKTILQKAFALYSDAKEEGKGEGKAELEAKHTLSLYFLAQVEGHLGNGTESAKLLAKTLHRQLTGEIDAKDWVVNATSISGFYINSGHYKQADHMLQAAKKVLDSRWAIPEAQVNGFKDESVRMAQLMNGEDFFPSLKLCRPESYAACGTYKEARKAFLSGMKALTKAEKFFVLDGFVTEHIKILQEKSQFWKFLAQREEDLSRRAKMHKRRGNLLRPVLHEISSSAYGNEIQQMADEVASSATIMLEIKEHLFPKLAKNKRSDAVNKINKLAHTAILYYRLFIRGFHKNYGPDPPDKIDAEIVKHYLTARFHIARLYSKIVGDTIPATCKLTQSSLEEYKLIVKLAKKYDCKDFKEELQICKDMVDVLPAKIANWQREASKYTP
eukprot:jgi/Bigna1/69975/fgenesh1_pg.10_\